MDITKINPENLPIVYFHEGGDKCVLVDGFFPVRGKTLELLTEATKREVKNVFAKFNPGSGYGLRKIATDQEQVATFIMNCQPFSENRRVKVFLDQLRDLNKPGCRNPAIIGGKIKEICTLLGNLKKVSSAPPKS